jgi:hypothetical protein
MQTQGRIFEGVPQGERIETSGTTDVWVDPSASTRRRTSVTVHNGGTPWRIEELVRDGVASTFEPDDPTQSWQYDAIPAPEYPASAVDDPMRRGEIDAYRRWLASGEATVTGSGEVPGTPTLLVEAKWGTSAWGVTVRADVRRSDHVPVRMTGERWNLIGGKHVVAEVWSARYVVAQIQPRSSVPSGAFDFAFPPGTIPRADYAVTPAQAVSFPSLKPRWLGATFAGYGLGEGKLRYRSRPPADKDMRFSPPTARGEHRPDFGSRWIQAEYGSTVPTSHRARSASRAMTVLSYPKVPREQWPSFDRGTATMTATVMVGGMQVLRATSAQGWSDVTYLVLDLEDATVVIEGIGATPAELDSAVRSLRRVGE